MRGCLQKYKKPTSDIIPEEHLLAFLNSYLKVFFLFYIPVPVHSPSTSSTPHPPPPCTFPPATPQSR